MLAPKYPAEAATAPDTDADADGGAGVAEAARERPGGGVAQALLLPGEWPSHAFVDPSLAAWKDLGLLAWPTVLLCAGPEAAPAGAGGGGDAAGKVCLATPLYIVLSGSPT